MENLPLHPSHLKASESSSFKSSKPSKPSKPLPKLHKSSKDSSFSNSRPEGEVRLTDLCPEDKARIGELVKRLALEKSQREEIESKFTSEKERKAKEMRKFAKENERMRAETRDLRAKYEKSLEILETYKQNDQMRNSWKDWEGPGFSRVENQMAGSMRMTPEPNLMSHIPISPIKEVNSVGVQTVCDKEIQTNEEIRNKFKQVEESPHSDAVKEIKNLKDDLFFLSESVRNCNLTSLRASQNLVKGKDQGRGDSARVEEERIKKLMERSEASTKRANALREGGRSEEFSLDKSHGLQAFEQSFSAEQMSVEKHQFSFKKESSVNSLREIGNGFYDEGLFQLVDDLEKMESRNYDFPEESEARFSDFSDLSKKSSIDSLEELRSRALRLKKTLKY